MTFFKKLLLSTVLAAKLLLPGGSARAESLAATQARVALVVQADPSHREHAERYLDIVRQHLGFSTVDQLRVTLGRLARDMERDEDFKKFCSSLFQCKQIEITTVPASTERTRLIHLTERDTVESLLSIRHFHQVSTRTLRNRISVETTYESLAQIAETKPVYLDAGTAAWLGVKPGWVLVVTKAEERIVKGKTSFRWVAFVMQL